MPQLAGVPGIPKQDQEGPWAQFAESGMYSSLFLKSWMAARSLSQSSFEAGGFSFWGGEINNTPDEN